ncbi:antibiotic biosynthesis monooxygenase [Rouxiella sp. S1S-2]|uniref:antibiotic biosynthesis monooxygenase n=1 Tax=Rouxiella sp. S1S-2 TaxID=2653856 RepID=UPI0012644913|nr:antibiotic biosynthesis monooxygenase [Rouxiella sp. S1S-2]KAB7894883.1 antibiotic biosynthesis monooxygenase [Rouxiella sp. S1S-2]
MDYSAQKNHVTLVITHPLLPGKKPEYEAWLEEIMPVAASFAGHLGVSVIRPEEGGTSYTILVRFESLDRLYEWINSPNRKALVEKASGLLDHGDREDHGDHIEIRPGAAFWFTPEIKKGRSPAKWKQFLVTLGVIFPSTNFVPWFWGLLLPAAKGTLWGHLLNDASVVALVVFLWMPQVTRLLRNWLIPKGQ